MLPTINLVRGSLSLLPILNSDGVVVSRRSWSLALSPSPAAARGLGRTGVPLRGRVGPRRVAGPRQGVVSWPFPLLSLVSSASRAGSARQGPFSAQEGSARSPAIVSMGWCGASGRGRPGVGGDGRSSPSSPPIGRCLESRQHRAGFVQPQGHRGKDHFQQWLPSAAPRAEGAAA